MRTLCRLLPLIGLVLAAAASPAVPAQAAKACPFISDQQLAGAMAGTKWSLVSDQDGRGCIFTGGRGDTLMLGVFRNPDKERAKELYAQFVKTLGERMTVGTVPGIGQEAQAGATAPTAARQEAAIVTLAGDYILSISLYRSGQPADAALIGPLSEVARRAIGNVANTSEKFGGCEWLTAEDADGFLETSSLTIQRTGAASCLMFDAAANTMMAAVIAMSRGTQTAMMKRAGGCTHVALPDLGTEAFAEHSCSSGNTNAVHIYVWKNGRQGSILFAPTKPHPQSGSVDRLKAVAGRVLGKM